MQRFAANAPLGSSKAREGALRRGSPRNRESRATEDPGQPRGPGEPAAIAQATRVGPLDADSAYAGTARDSSLDSRFAAQSVPP
jgi:hypothetical protein